MLASHVKISGKNTAAPNTAREPITHFTDRRRADGTTPVKSRNSSTEIIFKPHVQQLNEPPNLSSPRLRPASLTSHHRNRSLREPRRLQHRSNTPSAQQPLTIQSNDCHCHLRRPDNDLLRSSEMATPLSRTNSLDDIVDRHLFVNLDVKAD